MSAFSSRWMSWDENLDTHTRSADRTDKSTDVGADTSTQQTDKTDRSTSVGSVSSSREKTQKSSTGYTWRDFYPELDPAEWEITIGSDGSVYGEKICGQMVGTFCFLIPAEALRRGPQQSVARDFDTWDARVVQLPLGKNGQLVDWILWASLDRPGDFKLRRIMSDLVEPTQKRLF